ncbi:MAG: hypothetical protein ABS942_12625 [Solibacillus sp.]
MIGTIFQLSGALMLGYEIALRSRKQSISDAVIDGGSFDTPTRETAVNYASYHELYTTYAYRFGFSFIILGYTLPLFLGEYFDYLSPKDHAFLIVFISIVLLIISVNISKFLALNAFEKEEINK